MRSMETPFPDTECARPKELRWCLTLRKQEQKCEDMALAFAAHRLKPKITCLKARTIKQCKLWLRKGQTPLHCLLPLDFELEVGL